MVPLFLYKVACCEWPVFLGGGSIVMQRLLTLITVANSQGGLWDRAAD